MNLQPYKRYFRFLLILFLFLTNTAFSEVLQNSKLLKSVEDRYWQWLLENSLGLKMKFGLPISKLPDISLEEAERQKQFANSLLADLKRIKQQDLQREEQIAHRLLEWELQQSVELQKYYWLQFDITPYASPIPEIQRAFSTYAFEKAPDLDRYLSLLRNCSKFFKEVQRKLQGQVQRSIFIPKEELDLVVPFLRAYGAAPAESPFAVSQERLKQLPEDRTKQFQSSVADLIEREIQPMVNGIIKFLTSEYARKAPDAVGLSQYPEGKEYYRALVRYHTTMDVTPERVHETGLKEVARINAEMAKIREELGFQGTKEEFHRKLKTDPRFVPKSAEEIGEKLLSYDRKIAPKISQYFVRLPKAPHTVGRLDPKLEGAVTFGYYQVPTKADPKGIYYYNGSKLNERSLLNAGALIYHELVPGHHFQINLQSEDASLANWRKETMHTAYVEGWAEYASALAGELGMYTDPYDQYGRLSMDMFLSVRLVVDTGMNYLGWPRSKAVEFMKENLLESDTQIHTESLRYSCDIPGQALAYKMGSLKLLEMRKKLQETQGNQFDFRKFHDAVLSSGSMPMTVLETILAQHSF